MTTKISFSLGQIVATPAVLEALATNGANAIDFITRHVSGDWGDVCPEDKRANEEALQSGARLFSVYRLADGSKIWLITESTVDEKGSRPSTALLLPSDY
jgi:hypothetical protein